MKTPHKLCALFLAALFAFTSVLAPSADVLVNPYVFEVAGGGGSTAGADATDFDGSSDYLRHTDNTGWSASKLVTGSLWFKRGRSGQIERVYGIQDAGSTRFAINFNADDTILLFGRLNATTTVLNASSATTITDTNWHHLLFSVDLSSTSLRHVYIDDAAETMTWTTYANTNITFNPSNQQHEVAHSNVGGFFFDGALSEVWLNPTTYIDFSVEANRRKFITSGGIPEEVGTDGSTPTGTAPIDYLPDGQTQAGTGAAYAVTGTPTAVDGPNP